MKGNSPTRSSPKIRTERRESSLLPQGPKPQTAKEKTPPHRDRLRKSPLLLRNNRPRRGDITFHGLYRNRIPRMRRKRPLPHRNRPRNSPPLLRNNINNRPQRGNIPLYGLYGDRSPRQRRRLLLLRHRLRRRNNLSSIRDGGSGTPHGLQKGQSSKVKVQSSKFKVQSSKFKVQSSKFKVGQNPARMHQIVVHKESKRQGLCIHK